MEKANKEMPKVSVAIPSYNHDKFIGEAIESVINQTFTDWELVIADDASTDDSVAIVQKYVEKFPGRIRLIPSDKNQGPSVNSNIAHENAKGEYIALLCSDDRMNVDRLARQVAYLDSHPEVAMVCSDVYWINEKGERISSLNVFSKEAYDFKEQLLDGNFINASTVMFRRSIRNEIGGVNPVLDYVQDYDYWFRILENHEIAQLAERLTEYRAHGENISLRRKGDLAFASVYESFIAILRELQRRDGRIQKAEIDHAVIIKKKLALGLKAKEIELKFLGSFKYSLSFVYLLVLDILELDRENAIAINLLNEIYLALGDESRVMGQRSIKVKEESNVVQEMLTRALHAHNLIGGSLIQHLLSALENRCSWKEKKTFESQLICAGANKILDELRRQSTKGDISLVSKFGAAKEVVPLLRMQLGGGGNDQEIRSVLEQFCEHEEKHNYLRWVAGHSLVEIDGQLFAERMMLQWQRQPTFHLLLFLFPGEESLLADTIDSLAGQMYQQWRFSVIAGTPCPDPIFDQFDALQWIRVEQSENPYHVLNRTIRSVEADWVSILKPGAAFQPHALIRLGDYSNLNPDWRFLYVDEDVMGLDGVRMKPKFKPDFNLDLLRSDAYIGSFCAIDRTALLEIGGFQATPDFENYDLAFKVFERYGDSAFCHIADVLYHEPEESLRESDKAIKRIVAENHLIRSGVAAHVEEGYLPDTHRIVYHLGGEPKVSIIIPTRDKLELFQPCLESLMEKTDYPDFEVLVVNNQSRDPDILNYFETLPERFAGCVKVVDYDKPFNYSAISNLAARHAQGRYLLFLNNDTEIIQAEWLSRMMAHAQRPDVGIVGARLVLPEKGLVQHVGVVLGLDLIADHPYNGLLDIHSPGYMGRALLDQNYSAVTGACLLIKADIYHAVGGMDEADFPISYNDIDLCLKVKNAGFLVVWTPYATLIHHSSVSQKSERNPEEIARKNAIFRDSRDKMFFKWRKMIANDPAYNRNLSLVSRDFKVDSTLPCNWDVNFHDRVRVLGLPLQGGAGDYRVILPFEALSRSGLMQCEYIRLQANQRRRLNVAEVERLAPDTLVIHSAINDVELKYLEELKRYNKDLLIVFALDDLITQIPQKSSVYKNFMRHYRDAKPRLRKALSMCDRLVVSTQPLAELCDDMVDDIRIIPNRLNKDVWCNLRSLRAQSNKPRVGWAGAQQHQGDLEIIFEVVKETAGEFDWIFMGMCPEEIVPFVKENHAFVPFDQYPEKLASLNLDLAIAPLEECQFNDAKSNLRLLEYGVLGWPVVCSDVFPYRSYEAPVVRVKNEKHLWLDAIRSSLSDMDKNYLAGDRLREWVLEKFILEDHLDEWQGAFTR